MKKIIRTLSTIYVVIVCSFGGLAQNNASGMMPVNGLSVKPKLCSCQLVELQYQDYKKQRVGIFAEKDKTGRIVKSYRVMNEIIRKEKVYLYKGFVSNVKLLHVYKSDTDCMTLYYQLRQQNNNFRMYDILYVDVLLSIAGR